MFKQRLSRENFHPTWISVFINPIYFNRVGIAKGVKLFSDKITGKTLDYGCGYKPYKEYFNNVSQYIGIDVKSHGFDYENGIVDVYFDGKTIPFENETFDSVFSSEVFEHVFDIDDTLIEINRVLKKDGKMLFTIPFFWEEHAEPFDYCRYSSFGIKYLLEKHGFEVIGHHKSGNTIITIFQLWNCYFLHYLAKNRILRKLLMLISAINNISGIVLSKILPESKKIYLNNIILARKVK
jgi:SAM-dependent methyltransferase